MSEPLLEPLPLDLSECEHEPIHIPGAIQPHGLLFAAENGAGHRVVQVSANTEALLGLASARVLDMKLVELFDGACRATLEGALSQSSAVRLSGLRLAIGGRRWTGAVHQSGDLAIVELERWEKPSPEQAARERAAWHELMVSMLTVASVSMLHEVLARYVRELTGYDRVMVYLFDETGAGEVVAEDRAPELEPFLGLRYPASDIPAQARRLYLAERTRLIVDAMYQPAPIVPELHPNTGAALDLSHAVLRSVSPVHCAYLANMGVRGSMSLSLADEGRLFGLIACHHRAPRSLRPDLREACEWVGRIASFVHVTRTREHTNQATHRANRTLRGLCSQLGSCDEIGHALADCGPALFDLVAATGAVIHYAGDTHVLGRSPPPEVVEELIAWLGDVMHDQVYTTARLPSVHPEVAAAHRDTACGVLAVPLAADGLVAWLRPEVVRTVSWGGDPRKPVERDVLGQLGPRRSFARWRELVRGQAVPFEPWEQEVAENLQRLVGTMVARRAAELGRLNRELRQAVQARDDFLSMASHELKTPLSTLLLVVESLGRGVIDDSPMAARVTRRLEVARRQVVRLDQLVSRLLDVSRIRAGRLDLSMGDEDLAATVRDVVDRLSERGAPPIKLLGEPSVPCRFDRLRIDQVASNLIGNAVKYAARAPIEVEVSTHGTQARLVVRDHGPGIPRDLREKLFERFERSAGVLHVGGFGLGLWIAQAIVRAHGGHISIHDTPGGGATLVVELPRARAQRAEDRA